MLRISIIGKRVNKSLSPIIYNYLFKKSNNYIFYIKQSVLKNNIYRSIIVMLYLSFRLINITMPYKEFLLKICNFYNKNSSLSKSINLIVILNNKIYGYNSDGIGFKKSFLDNFKSIKKGFEFVIFGSGGASKGIVNKINLFKIKIYNRNYDNFLKFKNIFKKKKIFFFNFILNLRKNIIVNTIPSNIFLKYLKKYNKNQFVIDINYKIKKKNQRYFDGLKMLYFQALINYKIIKNEKIINFSQQT
ncbi:hypothetical protein [Candidatus Vidania fulgoroideorum]